MKLYFLTIFVLCVCVAASASGPVDKEHMGVHPSVQQSPPEDPHFKAHLKQVQRQGLTSVILQQDVIPQALAVVQHAFNHREMVPEDRTFWSHRIGEYPGSEEDIPSFVQTNQILLSNQRAYLNALEASRRLIATFEGVCHDPALHEQFRNAVQVSTGLRSVDGHLVGNLRHDLSAAITNRLERFTDPSTRLDHQTAYLMTDPISFDEIINQPNQGAHNPDREGEDTSGV